MIDVAIELLRDSFRAPDARGEKLGAAGRLLQRGDFAAERRQLLAELVVHLARDAAPLVFLREDQSGEQLGARAFAPRRAGAR